MGNAIRRANLKHYLTIMHHLRPTKVILIGEAPGYRGARLTGVPFTSIYSLLNDPTQTGIYGANQGYTIPDTDHNAPQREATATIIHATLAQIQPRPYPLMWNSFPYHPHQSYKSMSNRKPRKSERLIGQVFIQQLLDHFAIKTVVAVGNVAHQSLNEMNVPNIKVRHPAQGGKNQFVDGISRVYRSFSPSAPHTNSPDHQPDE